MKKKYTRASLLLGIILLINLAACTSAKIDRSTTYYDPDTQQVSRTEKCTAEYSNTSFGTFDGKEIHGCDAGGSSVGVDNTKVVEIPLGLLRTLSAQPLVTP